MGARSGMFSGWSSCPHFIFHHYELKLSWAPTRADKSGGTLDHLQYLTASKSLEGFVHCFLLFFPLVLGFVLFRFGTGLCFLISYESSKILQGNESLVR